MAIFSCFCSGILILIHKDDVAYIAAVDIAAAGTADVVLPYIYYNPGFPFFYHLIIDSTLIISNLSKYFWSIFILFNCVLNNLF